MHFTLFSTYHREKYLDIDSFTFCLCTIYYLVPNGVISFRRNALPHTQYPNWSNSKAELSQMHLTTDNKIEDVKNVLQVNTMILFDMQTIRCFSG